MNRTREPQDVADDRQTLMRLKGLLTTVKSCRQHRVIREAIAHITRRMK